MEILHSEAAQRDNALRLTAYAKSSPRANVGVRWRAVLRRDFYEHQCSFRVERWEAGEWREAYTVIDPSGLRIMGHSTREPVGEWRGDAEADALDLLSRAESLIY